MPINIIDKINCNGCNACFDACSDAQAITFSTDKEGFWYPKVDLDKCTDCGLCEKVCPELNADSEKLKVGGEPMVYAARHKNIEVIKDSTSGGIFTAFAELFYSMGGYVGGAVYDDEFTRDKFTHVQVEVIDEENEKSASATVKINIAMSKVQKEMKLDEYIENIKFETNNFA